MPNPLNSATCADAYTDAATIADVFNSGGGWAVVSSFGVFAELEYGVRGETYWTLEQELGEGASVTIPDNCIGIRFRNAVAGSNATVSAVIAEGDEPALGIISLGTVILTGQAGLLLKSTYLTSGTSFTTSSSTNQIRAILIGGGGGGLDGGGASNAASGGGAGGYGDTGLISVSPSTSYAYAVGAAGDHLGNPSSPSTLTIGGSTYMAGGGVGGITGSTFQAGGVGGSASSSLTPFALAITGGQGAPSITFNTSTYLIGGDGANSPLGFGGRGALAAGTNRNATAGTGYGSGGGGGVGTGTGSNGQPGLIIIEEYT